MRIPRSIVTGTGTRTTRASSSWSWCSFTFLSKVDHSTSKLLLSSTGGTSNFKRAWSTKKKTKSMNARGYTISSVRSTNVFTFPNPTTCHRLVTEVARSTLCRESTLKVPISFLSGRKCYFLDKYKPKGFLLREEFLPLLVDFALHLEFDFPELTRAFISIMDNSRIRVLANLLFLPAQLLFLQAHTLSSELLRKNRRITIDTAD